MNNHAEVTAGNNGFLSFDPFPAGQPVLRPAEIDDVIPLRQMANLPSTRRASIRSSDRISLPEHVRWLRQRLDSPDARLWVLDFHGLLLGSVRYERSETAAVISINVVPAFRRRGLAVQMILETAAAACRQFGVQHIHATVRRDNPASAAMFAKLGFQRIKTEIIQDQLCDIFEWANDIANAAYVFAGPAPIRAATIPSVRIANPNTG